MLTAGVIQLGLLQCVLYPLYISNTAFPQDPSFALLKPGAMTQADYL